MVWLRRRFAFAEYVPYLDVLEKLRMSNPIEEKDFVMVSTKLVDPHLSEYFVGLPDKSFASHFHDFDLVTENDLPKEIDAVLLGEQAKESFTSRFRVRNTAI